MKNYNIVKRLEKEGYNIIYKKWSYWDHVPYVKFEGFDFAIAEHVYLKNGWMGCRVDFIYNHVQEALHIAKNNNPILLKKIKESPTENYYLQYMITSMEDYYQYKQKRYHFNDYYKVLEKLKKEI